MMIKVGVVHRVCYVGCLEIELAHTPPDKSFPDHLHLCTELCIDVGAQDLMPSGGALILVRGLCSFWCESKPINNVQILVFIESTAKVIMIGRGKEMGSGSFDYDSIDMNK
eukprot:TRINITY_DN856_c0_g1_i1.p1 TRINITY_DN856_c0_g1~~TRINITY_DN856_c0_g1_i1.p1  ORF type:complete len:111 (-),score=9.87 TRINITY_DN856_c0_g1_i1:98-430(-)